MKTPLHSLTLFLAGAAWLCGQEIHTNFTASEGYRSGDLSRHADWSGASARGSITVDPAGSGVVMFASEASRPFVMAKSARPISGDKLTASYDFKFVQAETLSQGQVGAVFRGNLSTVAQRVQRNEGITFNLDRQRAMRSGLPGYRLSFYSPMITSVNGEERSFGNMGIPDARALGLSTDESESDNLRLTLMAEKGSGDTWTLTLTIENLETDFSRSLKAEAEMKEEWNETKSFYPAFNTGQLGHLPGSKVMLDAVSFSGES